MISCQFLYDTLKEQGVNFFAGVPDSLLKDFCAYVAQHGGQRDHVITANEGGAVAIACGVHLATGRIPLVYMQNSGLGNAINPLVSLVDNEVYAIPLLMLIGWRGEPGQRDEPQHIKQGKITVPLLETMRIPYRILPDMQEDASKSVNELLTQIRKASMPGALVVRKNTFDSYLYKCDSSQEYRLSREKALQLIAAHFDSLDIIVSTTGKISRELYEYRDTRGGNHEQDFLTVGSMGHASQIGLGIAMLRPERQVFCLDGDGAAIMHMGSMAVIGSRSLPNFKHVILNNGCHDSVGGQPTVGYDIEFMKIARACGYRQVMRSENEEDTVSMVQRLISASGPGLLEIRVSKGARCNLGRPKTSPQENKTAFMSFIQT